jgi:hypothetical protein
MRATLAKDYPGIGWIGLSDMNEKVGKKLKEDIGADYYTDNFRELIARPEVDAVIIATSTWARNRSWRFCASGASVTRIGAISRKATSGMSGTGTLVAFAAVPWFIRPLVTT